MKNERGIPLLLLALCLALCLFMGMGKPAEAADADEDSYAGAYFDVWVGGIQVNSDNKMDVLGDHKVSYDPWTQTLTFWGDVTLTNKKESALIYSKNMNLTIAGRGKITAADGVNASMCVRTMNGSLTIDGNFTLQGVMYAVYSQKDITLSSGSIEIIGTNYGIFANNTMTVENGVFQVEASGGIKAIYARRGLNLGDEVEITDPDGGLNDGSSICDADFASVEHTVLKGSGPEKRDAYRVTFAGGYVTDVVWEMEVPAGFSVADVIWSTAGIAGWDNIFREVQKSGRYYYADYYTTDEDGKKPYPLTTPVTEDITVYASWDEAIEEVLVQVNPVYCGTEVITPRDEASGSWKWTNQTGTPLTFVIPGYHYDVFNGYEGNGKAFLWMDEDGENALTDTVLKGGETYHAEISLIPDDGYYFRPNAEVRVNGATLVSYDFTELGFIGALSVEVEPIHSFGGWQVEKEPTNKEDGLQFQDCSVCGTREYASIPRKTDGATVYVEFGEGHEALASRLYGSDHVVEGSRVEFVTTTEPTVVHFINECAWKITEAVFYRGMLDNGEMFTDLLGLKPIEEYESVDAALAEKAAFGESHLEDGMVFYAHWAKPVEDMIDVTLKGLTCTTEVKLTEHDDYYTQSPKPSYTISKNVKTASFFPGGGPEAYWVDFFWGMESPKEGRYDDMDFCAAVITVKVKYGQYIPKDRIRFPGGNVLKTEWGLYHGVMNIFLTVDLPHTFKEVPGTGQEPDNMYSWQSPDHECTKCGYYQNGEWHDPVYPEVTVTYDAAGGSGTMEPDVLTMYDPYTFPECKFTAPEGKTFAGWMVDKVEFPAGYEVDGITDSFTATAVWRDPWTSLQSQISAAEEGAVITLEEDVTAGAGNLALEIPEGKSLTLDLNGHTIDRGLSQAASYGNAITVNGRLTITGEGTITGAYNSGSGGAITNNGYLIIENGTFDSNVGKEAGAVFNASGATLEVRGGTYTGNSATTWGGGAIVNYGTMFMSGGKISGNSVPMNGGGVWTYGSLTLTGGEITGNTAGNGGGIYFKGGTFELSGDPVVKGNTPNNVNMLPGMMFTVNEALSENASIGVRPESKAVPVQITTGLAGKGGAGNFFSDNTNLAILTDDNGEAIVADPPEILVENLAWDGHTVSWEYPGTSAAMACMVSYFYTYYAVGDQENSTLKEGTLTSDYNDGVWSADFTPVVEDIGAPNMGIIQFTISYADLTGGNAGNAHAYDGSVTVHLVMALAGKAGDAGDGTGEAGGTIIAEGPGYYFDGETVNLTVEEDEGYKLTLLAHKKGSDTSFTLDENDDMFYQVTGEFTRVAKVTLETGEEMVARNIAGRYAAQADPFAPIVEYEGGTAVTYYVPYGTETEGFYQNILLKDTLDLISDARFAGVGPQQLGAYQSSEEVEADRNSLPDTVTDEMTWYVLWAQPVRDAVVTVEPLKAGTQVTSTKTADGNTVQDPEPDVTVTGEVELAKDTTAAWLDKTFNTLNGTAEEDGGLFAVGLTPKFGYYFDGESEGSLRINGNPPLGVMNFYSVYLVYGDAAPADNKAAELETAEEAEEEETAEAEASEAETEESPETETAEAAESEEAEAPSEESSAEEETPEEAPASEAEPETPAEPASETPAETESAPETEAAPSDTASVFGGGGIAAIIIAAVLAAIGIAVYLRRKKGGAA